MAIYKLHYMGLTVVKTIDAGLTGSRMIYGVEDWKYFADILEDNWVCIGTLINFDSVVVIQKEIEGMQTLEAGSYIL